MLEIKAMSQSCIPQVQIGWRIAFYMRILLLAKSFDFRPSSQYIVVGVIPSCFRFANTSLRLITKKIVVASYRLLTTRL
jgi:hypothetical protein